MPRKSQGDDIDFRGRPVMSPYQGFVVSISAFPRAGARGYHMPSHCDSGGVSPDSRFGATTLNRSAIPAVLFSAGTAELLCGIGFQPVRNSHPSGDMR